MKRFFVAAALSLAGIVSCGPNPKAPVRVMVLAPGKDGYRTTEVELRTVTELTALKGEAAELRGGGRIVGDPKELPQTGSISDEQLEQILVKDRGLPPRANFIERTLGNRDVLYVPADFHSWNMATTYYNFERSLDYFQSFQVIPKADIDNPRVFYFPEMTLLELGPNPLVDNALYFSAIHAFGILPFDQLQMLPLSMNYAVVAHEFSHWVWNKRVYRGQALPDPLIRWIPLSGSTPGINILKAMDEGLADFHAYGVTCQSPFGCDPAFLRASLGEPVTGARDLSIETRCMTKGLREAYLTAHFSEFSEFGLEYAMGTLIASALYQAGTKTAQLAEVQKGVLLTYSDTSGQTPGLEQLIYLNIHNPEAFTLGAAMNALVTHMAPSVRIAVCNEFLDHLQIPLAELPACPATAAAGTCPNIN